MSSALIIRGSGGLSVLSHAMAHAVSYSVKRAIRFPYVPLPKAAVRSFKLCDAAEVPAVNPFIWDRHLPRIRSAARYTAEHTITHFIRRPAFQFRPVMAHWLRDATLLDGSVYSRGYRHELRPWGRRSRLGFKVAGPVAEIEQGALASTSLGSTWWGHWLEDEVPLQMLAEQYGPPVAHDREPYRDESVFRTLLGVAEPARFGVALFKELLVLDDHAQNPLKTARYHVLRGRASHRPAGPSRLFLSRGASGARRILVNEAEIRARLEREGFTTVDVGAVSADELIAACSGASVVVSVEGSHLAPLLYLMRDFGTMVILNPPYQVQTTVATVALFCGISSGMFICEPDGESRTDFVADPDEVVRFVDFFVGEKPRRQR
ncbi:MAG: glycosyltransferase family 61 protein, partial [Acidobacteriota bacterium]